MTMLLWSDLDRLMISVPSLNWRLGDVGEDGILSMLYWNCDLLR